MTEPPEVELREVRESDLEVFFLDQADEEAARMAAFPSRTRDRFMEHWKTKVLADPGAVVRTVLAGGEVAGNLVIFDGPTGREVGYWIGRRFWGRGVATAALAALLREVDERPLSAHVAKHNPGSLRVLQKCGFEIVAEERVDDVDEFVLRLDAAGD
jgi:RimJ/RimL family protein N-acetyltransferase